MTRHTIASLGSGDLASRTYFRFASYYLEVLQAYPRAEDVPEGELTQCLHQVNRLRKQANSEAYAFLAAFFAALFPVLSLRADYAALEPFCEDVLAAYQHLHRNPASIYRMLGQIHVALGKWEKARDDFHLALEYAPAPSSREYGETLLALGRLKFNQGDYRAALNLFDEAKRVLEPIGDTQFSSVILAEIAALHMNRGYSRKALHLYKQIEQDLSQANDNASSLHTLLMLGVIYRRLRQYAEAERYLREVLRLAAQFEMKGTIATGLHHLAWAYIDQKKLDQADEWGRQALELYVDMGDVRGLADAYEQLGEIEFIRGNHDAAVQHLEKSLSVRNGLANRQGSASSLKRLAKVHFSVGRFQSGLRYLCRCIVAYHRVGGLNLPRMVNLVDHICIGLWHYFRKRLLQ